MKLKISRIGGVVCGAALLLLLAAEILTLHKHHSEVDSVSDVQKIARTLEIIRTSTPNNHKVLKVLFYGQSITRSGWDKIVVDHWHEKYPNVDFVVANRALGGFASQNLVRTTEQDIHAFYPDLIIFHVYGDHHAYERILRMFRSETAADVILQTDHGEVLPDPTCEEGLQFDLRGQPGCAGVLWVHQRLWGDEMSYHKIPAFAKKYGMAIEPQRQWWREYLLQTHVDPKSLLADYIHPNDKGKELIAALFNRYFDNLVEQWKGQTEHNVTSLPPSAATFSDGKGTLSFAGSRIELLTPQPLPALPAIEVDGVSPNSMDGCYQVTRSSPLASVPDWPAVARISLLHNHTPEDWVATVTGFSADQKSFAFSVHGSVTGDEGAGDSSHRYVSRSGQVAIDAQDWMFERAYNLKHIPAQAPYEVDWSVKYECGNQPEFIDHGDGTVEYRYVLATGLTNGNHTLQLNSVSNGLANAREFRIYEPPMHEN